MTDEEKEEMKTIYERACEIIEDDEHVPFDAKVKDDYEGKNHNTARPAIETNAPPAIVGMAVAISCQEHGANQREMCPVVNDDMGRDMTIYYTKGME